MMKFIPRKIFLLGFLAALLGLACSQMPDKKQESALPEASFATFTDAEQAWREFELRCAQEPCPANIGTMLSLRDNSITACTFSLVAPTIAMTNRHCFPEGTQVGASCDGNVKFTLLAQTVGSSTERKQEVLECESILSFPTDFSEDDFKTRDYIFIRLKTPSEQRPLEINTQGIADGEMLTTYTAMPRRSKNGSKEKLSATFQMKQCESLMGSFALLSYLNKQNPLVSIYDCDVSGGVAGAPLLNPQGQIMAVMQGTYLEKQGNLTSILTPSKNSIYHQFLSVLRTEKFSLATNGRCLESTDLGIAAKPSNSCLMTSVKDNTFLKDFIQRGSQKEDYDLDRYLKVALSGIDKFSTIFKLQPVTQSNLTDSENLSGVLKRIIFSPKCFRGTPANNSWAYSLKSAENYLPSANVFIESKSIQVLLKSDHKARAVLGIREEPRKLSIGFSPAKLMSSANKKTSVKIGNSSQDFEYAPSNTTTVQLGFCGEE